MTVFFYLSFDGHFLKIIRRGAQAPAASVAPVPLLNVQTLIGNSPWERADL